MPSRLATPMYLMKPIYQQSEIIDLPNCMYKMKNIHAVDFEVSVRNICMVICGLLLANFFLDNYFPISNLLPVKE